MTRISLGADRGAPLSASRQTVPRPTSDATMPEPGATGEELAAELTKAEASEHVERLRDQQSGTSA
ncbi:hypothetical protein [Agrococcus sp. Marseille-Q4369]|uniref:hypothetical protein n=1 Tax=Agrococcus sp. Marseille-Q4369 TaxID=2810513 RepID=UPI001B8CF471|nr:hypothetical protein [Agrococcus sp. Marseille-Q4369]QUW18752.1 hypothetical protein JSQ78_13380 [Agrococcus sp. Marseille-Q4369]